MEWLALAEDLVSRARELMRCGVPLPLCGDSSAVMAATGRARDAYPAIQVHPVHSAKLSPNDKITRGIVLPSVRSIYACAIKRMFDSVTKF